MINYVHRLASVQEQRLPGTGPEPGIDELPRSVDHTPTNKVRYNVLSMLLYKSIVKENRTLDNKNHLKYQPNFLYIQHEVNLSLTFIITDSIYIFDNHYNYKHK